MIQLCAIIKIANKGANGNTDFTGQPSPFPINSYMALAAKKA